jgi:hypothetical protein
MISRFIQKKGKRITEQTNSILNFTSIRVVIVRLTVNAKVATVLGSIPAASSDTLEYEAMSIF